MQRLAIGIDIGGQSSKCGVVTQDGTILSQSVVTSLIDSFDEYLELLANTVKDLVRKTADRGVAVGIGPGAEASGAALLADSFLNLREDLGIVACLGGQVNAQSIGGQRPGDDFYYLP